MPWGCPEVSLLRWPGSVLPGGMKKRCLQEGGPEGKGGWGWRSDVPPFAGRRRRFTGVKAAPLLLCVVWFLFEQSTSSSEAALGRCAVHRSAAGFHGEEQGVPAAESKSAPASCWGGREAGCGLWQAVLQPPSLGMAGGLGVASLLEAGVFWGISYVPGVCLCAGLCGGSLLGNGCDRLHFGSGVEILLKGVLAVFGVSLGCWCPSEAACRLRSGLCGADVAAGGAAGALGVAVLSSAASLKPRSLLWSHTGR